MSYGLRFTPATRFSVWSLALVGLCALRPAGVAAQTAKPPVTKADSAKAKASTTKAPAKPAPTKTSTTTTKPAPTKPSTTTTKPAPAPTKTATDSKPAPTPAKTDAKAPATTPASTTRAAAPATRPAASTGGGVRNEVEAYSRFGLYAGGATASLGFGAGPSGGLVWRVKSASLPFVFRLDVSASRFTQQPLTNAGVVAGDASLLHAGGALGFELVPGRASQSLRPYLTVSGGIYRFQGSGPAGTNGDIVDGVFATTNDVALLAGAGLRLGQRLFLEARFVTVGDFQSIPVVIGVHF
jgi:hypothetical protein